MKRRPFIATLAAIAAPPLALSVTAAMEIAHHEIARHGLAETHQVSALYAGADRQTEGAAFAVIVRPRLVKKGCGLKLLIHEDGRATLQPIPPRTRAHA